MKRVIIVWLMVFLGGCARYPELRPPAAPERRLYFELAVKGGINPNFYYFIAIDTNGNPADGPKPFVGGPPPYIIGNGWCTEALSFHIQYHQGAAKAYDDRLNPLWPNLIGPPFDYRVSPDGKTLMVTLDLGVLRKPDGTLVTSTDTLDINFITTDSLSLEVGEAGIKVFDGLGASGNNYRTVPLDMNLVYPGADEEGDVSVADFGQADDLDITGWKIEVKLD